MSISSGFADTDNGVILTVPAGKQWNGNVTLSAAHAAALGAALTTKKPKVVVNSLGGTSDPVDESVVASVALATPLINLLSLLGSTSANSVTVPNVYVIADASNDAQLVLHTDGTSSVVATAFGFLVP